jgi:hypothetical protein
MSYATRQKIEAFNKLRPIRYPLVSSFRITRADDGAYSLQIVSFSDIGGGRLTVTFFGIREVTIDWPQWDEVRLDVVEITDISDRGLEEPALRVHEGAGFFAFSCHDFTAIVE